MTKRFYSELDGNDRKGNIIHKKYRTGSASSDGKQEVNMRIYAHEVSKEHQSTAISNSGYLSPPASELDFDDKDTASEVIDASGNRPSKKYDVRNTETRQQRMEKAPGNQLHKDASQTPASKSFRLDSQWNDALTECTMKYAPKVGMTKGAFFLGLVDDVRNDHENYSIENGTLMHRNVSGNWSPVELSTLDPETIQRWKKEALNMQKSFQERQLREAIEIYAKENAWREKMTPKKYAERLSKLVFDEHPEWFRVNNGKLIPKLLVRVHGGADNPNYPYNLLQQYKDHAFQHAQNEQNTAFTDSQYGTQTYSKTQEAVNLALQCHSYHRNYQRYLDDTKKAQDVYNAYQQESPHALQQYKDKATNLYNNYIPQLNNYMSTYQRDYNLQTYMTSLHNAQRNYLHVFQLYKLEYTNKLQGYSDRLEMFCAAWRQEIQQQQQQQQQQQHNYQQPAPPYQPPPPPYQPLPPPPPYQE